MENQTPKINIPSDTVTNKSVKKLAIIGFLLMLAGPGTLILVRRLAYSFPRNSLLDTISIILTWAAIALPAAGAVLCIIHLVKCSKAGTPKNPLSIVTLVMCNPLFYFIYFVACALMGSPLTGLSMM